MKKGTLVQTIADQLKMKKKDVEAVLDTWQAEVIAALKRGEIVTMTGFGQFMAKRRHSRMGVNPQKPNERIRMPEVVVAKFKTGKVLKESLKSGQSVDAAVHNESSTESVE